MTDTIDGVAPTASIASTPPVAPQEPRRPDAQEPSAAESLRPEPIALNVTRGEDGVFVYTLSDPSTGRLVAVIPDTKAARTAGNYSSGGWVSLTA